MTEPIAYLDEQWIHASKAAVPVYDVGFVQGVAVAEQLRTFAGKLFELPKHLQRLKRSLEIVGLKGRVQVDPLAEAATHLAAHNAKLLPDGSDLGLCMFVTPGPYATFAAELPADQLRPTVCMHTYPLPFQLWAHKYQEGQTLLTTSVRQIPANCWPAELKCRSRMHYFLADREAAATQPDARALLLDQDGFVAEASTANVVAYFRNSGLVTPRLEKILPGISIAVATQLAQEMGIASQQRDLTLEEFIQADEILLCSTSICLLPVVQVNGQAIGDGRPGETFQRLLSAWSSLVGVDLPQQARTMALAVSG